MAPPDTDPGDGAGLPVSLASAIAVNDVTVSVSFVFWYRLGYSNYGMTSGCDGDALASGHEVDCIGLCAQFLVDRTWEGLYLGLTLGPGDRQGGVGLC